MSKDEEYELLPRSELEYMRKEVERLKRNPLGDTQASISLLESIGKLNESVTRLVHIFESANDEMSRAVQDTGVQEQLRKLREENAKIAHGIVAVADLVKEVRTDQKRLVDESHASPFATPASLSPPLAGMDEAPMPPSMAMRMGEGSSPMPSLPASSSVMFPSAQSAMASPLPSMPAPPPATGIRTLSAAQFPDMQPSPAAQTARKNPFADPLPHEFSPIIEQPLPRPGAPAGAPRAGGMAMPPPVPRAQQPWPGADLAGDDVPPPPPR